MSPKVSICIPAYKNPHLLRRSLESVRIQKYLDYEVVITDDSGDSAVERIVQEYNCIFDRKIKYFKNGVRKGSPENWNESIRRASGEYIKFLHHDDWFTDENSLGEFVGLLNEAPQADFAFSSSQNFRQGREFVSTNIASPSQLRKLRRNPKILFVGNFIGDPSATIYRRKINLFFDSSLIWLVDVDFYIRVLLMNNKFEVSSRPLVSVTCDSNEQITAGCIGNKSIELFESLYLYRKISNKIFFDYRNIIFMTKLLKRYQVFSKNEFQNAGLSIEIPNHIRYILPFLRIYSIATNWWKKER
jgi:glycosyltransferase involved in cell wall biosynthesis